ncbi:MAG: class I SAM-dependent methyltransferase [Nanoarchaeota archaeon]|nr:class I SAM-dependent methyltransferase [Nanoarchaeota archaeon]
MAINNLKVLVVIPARGGSKGLPGKNIKEICGKPLVAWSIEQAKGSKYVDKVIVSTDDQEIADIAKKYGAEVPFLRPAELATDTSSVADAVLDVIKNLEEIKECYEIVVALEPTKCIRESLDIDNCLKQLVETLNAKSIVTLFPIDSPAHPDWAASVDENKFIEGRAGDTFRRQNLSKKYLYSGFILASYVSSLKESKSFYNSSVGYIINEKEKGMDINDAIDFVATEAVMKLFLKNKKKSVLELVSGFRNKKIVLFGAASSGKRTLLSLLEKGLDKKDILFYDNNPEKWGKEILGVNVLSLDELKQIPEDTPILISSCMFVEITNQLEKLGFTDFHYIRDLLYSRRKLLKYDEKFEEILDSVSESCNMDSEEKFTLYSSVKAISKLGGDIAEVGVYKGGSAKILCEIMGDKVLHLFDTFEGLPETEKGDLVIKGWLNDTSMEGVRDYLREYDNVFLYKGIFPETSFPVKDKKFCLVHLDTDIYSGTLESLKFFWPRMIRGGRIICHDYNNVDCPGVKKAFEEFFVGREDLIIDIADTQGMVIKDE